MTNLAQQIDHLTSEMVIESIERNDKYKTAFDAYKTNLWNTPEARNKEILMQWAEYLADKDDRYDGDAVAPVQYWTMIVEQVATLTLDEVNAIPFPDRGDKWATMRAFLVAVCWWQAYIAVYVKADAIAGVTNGNEIKTLLKGANVRKIRKSMNLKKTVKGKTKTKGTK